MLCVFIKVIPKLSVTLIRLNAGVARLLSSARPERRHTGQLIACSGSHGFVGTRLTQILESKGFKVIPIPRDYLSHVISLWSFFEEAQPDYIFHLAAFGNMAHQTDDQEIFTANVIATFNMLKASLDIPYKAFINVSSSSAGLPIQTMYSATKIIGENLVQGFVDVYDKPILSVRPFSVYGPGEADFRFIPTVIRSILLGSELPLDPHPVHDWIYVDDLVSEMMMYMYTAKITKGKIWEIGTGNQYTNGQVVGILEDIAGKKANIKLLKKPIRSFDNQSWRAEIGMLKARSLYEGLKLTYEYYKKVYL